MQRLELYAIHNAYGERVCFRWDFRQQTAGGAGEGDGEPGFGRIIVRNETGTLDTDSRAVDLTVKYTDPSGNTLTTMVAPGENEVVTGDQLLENGTQVQLIVEAVQSEGRSSTYKQVVRIRTSSVSGDVEIRVVAVRDGQQLEGVGFEIVRSMLDGQIYVQNRDSGLSLSVTVTLVDGRPPTQDDLPSDMSPGQEIEIPSSGGPIQVTEALAGGIETKLHFMLRKRRNMEMDRVVRIDGNRLVVFGPETNIEEFFVDFQERPY